MGSYPDWVLDSLCRTVELLRLKPGWNSYAAAPISVKAAATSLDLLTRLALLNTPPPSIVPLSTGGIQYEWHVGDIDLEIEIDEHGSVSGLFQDARTGAQGEWEGGLDLTALRPRLDLLLERTGRRHG